MTDIVEPATQPLVYLATCSKFHNGEPGAETLIPTLNERGLRAQWVVWNDSTIDWNRASLVAIRATWDYQEHLPQFLAWAAELGDKLWHDLPTITWNTDKTYMLDLERMGVPIVPTVIARTLEEIKSAWKELPSAGKMIVKPTIGASGNGIDVVEASTLQSSAEVSKWLPCSEGPWVVQPFVESVLTEGETSVFMMDGQVTAQFEKRAAAGEFRVHEERGGKQTLVEPGEEAKKVTYQARDATETLLQGKIGYARFDLLRWQDRLVVSEVEITEPALYFDRIPVHAEAFARMVARLIQA